MKRMDRFCLGGETTEYPFWGMVLVAALMLVSPFVSDLIPYVAFVICLYRIVRYDAKVFATDYCVMAPMMSLMRTTGGMTLVVWLCLFAALWYLIRGGLKADSALVWLLLLLNYLVLRMQLNITDFVLCFGHMAMFYVVLLKQDEVSAQRSIKAFVISLLLSSIYALALRNTWQLRSIVGQEGEAIWGTGILRFQGLLADPNYYMTLLIVGLVLLCKLKDSGMIKTWFFIVAGIALIGFGALTASKTFLLVLLLLVGAYVLWQFWNKKVFRGIFISLIAVGVSGYLLFSENSPFAVVLERLLAAENVSGLTTGRTDVYGQYLKKIFETPLSALLGYGLGANGLHKDPHNLILEIAYYLGVVGLGAIVGYTICLFRQMKLLTDQYNKQNFFAKYLPILFVGVLYFTLQGMFQSVFYAELFLVLLALLLIKRSEEEIAVDVPEGDICSQS